MKSKGVNTNWSTECGIDKIKTVIISPVVNILNGLKNNIFRVFFTNVTNKILFKTTIYKFKFSLGIYLCI